MKTAHLAFVIALLAAVAPAIGSATGPIVLKTDLQDTEPKFVKNTDGSFGGICVDLMRLIEKSSSYKFSWPNDFVPRKRLQTNLESGATDTHFGLAKTADQEKILIYAEPLYEVKYILIANADDNIDVRSVADIQKLGKEGTVLGVFGTSCTDYLKKGVGLTVDDAGKDPEENLEKLLNRRARLFGYHDLGLLYVMNQPKYRGKFKVLPIELDKFQHWAVFSREAPESTVRGVVEVIRKLKASGEWGKVTAKYLK